jgi:hypothetical protein
VGQSARVSDAEIIAGIKAGLAMTQIAGDNSHSRARVKRLAKQNGLCLAPSKTRPTVEELQADQALKHFFRSEGRKHFEIDNGVILVGSDAHYWPGLVSTAHRGFLSFCRNLRPRAVILNGDGFDGASISRYPRIGWDKRPTVKQELDSCKDRMGEIEEAAGTKNLFWPLGNHDARFETFLAQNASEYEAVQGFRLKDHFPMWRACWALWVNQSVVIKHRYKGGTHAGHNNTLWAGKTMVTGHDHHLGVTPFTDYNGTRWGVRTGTLAHPHGPQFEDYTEDAPKNHISGFSVLTLHNGKLLWPEIVRVIDEDAGTIDFRGTVGTV